MPVGSKSNKSRGFSALETIIVVIVVVALGLGGWYVWQRNPETPVDQSDFSENGSYLVIKEWGVEIPLTEEIADAYYEFRSDNLAEYVALYDASFDRLKNSNGVSCGGDNAFQLYSITRAKPENIESLNEFAGPRYQKFPFTDEWLFGGLGANQAPPPCSNLNPDPQGAYQEDTAILSTAAKKENAFDTAFKGLQQSD
jgi:hypothetical protein